MSGDVQAAVQRVRDAKDGSGLTGADYLDFLEEILADAAGWQMERDDIE